METVRVERATKASRVFALFSLAALLVLINFRNEAALIAACGVFGFSVGNLITLPSLIVQREFDQHAFGVLVSLPPLAVTALLSFNVMSPTFTVAASFAGGLLAIDTLACFAVARLLDRERLITGTKATSGSYRVRGA